MRNGRSFRKAFAMKHPATSAAAFGFALLAASCYAETPSVADGHVHIYSQLSTGPRAATIDEAIRPFRVNIPEAALVDLRQRVRATRWPDKETVADRSQGIQLAKLQELIRYWGTDYDWRKAEAKLNALPQFVTTIDGLDIHFIHVRSKHENALPIIVTRVIASGPLPIRVAPFMGSPIFPSSSL